MKEPLKNNFEGYVFNKNGEALSGVKIIDVKNKSNYVLTNRNGFFKLRRNYNIDNESSLKFIKNGYMDSLVLIRINKYHPNSYYFLFLRRESDTLKMIKNNDYIN